MQDTKIQGLPWIETDVFKLQDIYQELSLQTVEPKPGPERKPLNNYTELFGQNVGNVQKSSTEVEENERTKPKTER